MIKIPSQSKWIQSNRGDIFGSIWSSFNLDLTAQRDRQKGNIRTTRMLLGATSATLTDMGTPVAFKKFNSVTFALAGAELYVQGAAHTSAWAKVGSSPTNFSVDSDMEIFNGILYVTEGTDNDLQKYDGSSWGTAVADVAVGANAPHMMCVYANQLYISGETGGNSVVTGISTAEATIVTLTITDALKNNITFLRPTTNGIWIGTVNTRGGKGTIWFWDGAQTTPNTAYHLDSGGVLAGVVKDDILYAMDVDGRLLAFNGGTFVEVDRLPIKENYLTFALGNSHTRFIHPNGMTVADDRILMLIDNNYYIGALKDAIPENVPSGIWEWSQDTGLYHKYSLSHCPISGAGGGSVTDYGQNRLGVSGALGIPGACAFIKQNQTPSNDNGVLFAGARVSTTATAQIYGIFIDDLNDTVQKYGYFVTPKIYSQNLQDAWQKVFVRHRKLLNSTDKIIVKYRVDEVDSDEATITWVDTDTFTVTASLVPDLAVGDEVEVIQGDGSGKCAHVSSYTGTTTLTVNLDDTFTGATTRTAKARFQKWKKCAEGTSQTVKFHQFHIGANDTWVQLKVCMQFTGENEVDDLLLVNDTYSKAA
jgi:hypothetical protein